MRVSHLSLDYGSNTKTMFAEIWTWNSNSQAFQHRSEKSGKSQRWNHFQGRFVCLPNILAHFNENPSDSWHVNLCLENLKYMRCDTQLRSLWWIINMNSALFYSFNMSWIFPPERAQHSVKLVKYAWRVKPCRQNFKGNSKYLMWSVNYAMSRKGERETRRRALG